MFINHDPYQKMMEMMPVSILGCPQLGRSGNIATADTSFRPT